MQEFIDFISTVGFPIALSSFMIIKVDKTLDTLTQAIYSLRDYMERGGDEDEVSTEDIQTR